MGILGGSLSFADLAKRILGTDQGPASTSVESWEKQQKLVWAGRLRTLAALVLASVAAVSNFLGLFPFYAWAYWLFALAVVVSLITTQLFRRGLWLDTLSRFLVTGDMVAITSIVWVTGGVESPFLVLFPFEIAATGSLGDEYLSRDNALLGTLLFAAMAWSIRLGYLKSWPFAGGVPPLATETGYVVAVTAMVGVSMVLAHFANGYLARRLRFKERELLRVNRNLSSLYELSQRISASLRTDDVLGALLNGVIHGLGYERATVVLTDRSGRPVLIRSLTHGGPDLPLDPALLEGLPRMELPQLGGRLVWVPIRLKGETLGALAAEAGEGVPAREDALTTLRTFVGQMAVAIENARLYETTERLARTDGLTGLYNRRYFQERLEEEFFRARRYNEPLSLVLLDIDHFKVLNDSQGHTVGDEVLKCVSSAMIGTCRRTDLPARFGGDEFALLLPVASRTIAVRLAERIRTKVRTARFPSTRAARRVTLSAGVSHLRSGMTTPQALLESADACLYEAKRRGRDQTIADPLRRA